MANGFLLGIVLQSVAVFAEPAFPSPDYAGASIEVPGAQVAESVEELVKLLDEVELLVWRHGSAFPAQLWSPFVAFLERGGSLLHLGGEPFTRPVVGASGARVMQPRTVSLLKALRLNQSYRVAVAGARLEYVGETGIETRSLGQDAWVSVLEPRFSDTKDFDDEDGAPGARDAILHPLGFLHDAGGDSRFPVATASYVIDRLLGRFAGGRWVFHLTNEPPTEAELELLLREARRPAADLRVDPTFGCFHVGEKPSVNVRLHRPLAHDVLELRLTLAVRRPDGSTMSMERSLRAGRHVAQLVPLDVGAAPGLYRVTAEIEGMPAHETGFWIMDGELFTSGGELSMGPWAMERNAVPEPVIGTTVMSGSVHRKFLFEPNAAEWHDTFAELASIDVNLVRTGVWSAYKKISLDANVVDEAFLRALEAYYLSARAHGIPVVFTFFAFMPEAFGGQSPYFDPRSIDGQRAYLAAVARRFAGAKEIYWDLINEPSFANPDKLWLCRPNGDRFEHAAFTKWLAERHSGSPDGRTWQDVVRARWRLRPDEAIGVPTKDDFAERQVMEHHRPYRAKEYAHFAQDAFRHWVSEMTRAIRDAGSDAAITVGQDEGGLFERPNPLFHHDAVDFTSIHTWWFNDALLWDGLMAKARGKPLLASESGIMQRELLSGEAIRTPEVAAALLQRKLAYAFASGAFGLVQWCYQVNPYMASDNEVGIGIKRVDGSYKPEHGVLRDFAAFFARNRGRFTGYREPDNVLLFPSSDHYSPRGLQEAASKRLLGVLSRTLGSVRVVPEHRTIDLGRPDLIVLPSCRGVSHRAWADVMNAVSSGAELHASGWFETDDAGLPATRLGARRRPLARVEVHQEPGAEPRAALFAREAFESWGRAWYPPDAAGEQSGNIRMRAHGRGRIVHNELPLDWAESYVPWGDGPLDAESSEPPAVYHLWFDEVALIVAVNESSVPITIPATSAGTGELAPGAARLLLVTRADPHVAIDSTP